MTKKIKSYFARLTSYISPKLFFTLSYLHNRAKLPNFKHPKDLSEIWIKWVLDGGPNKHYLLADKYLVRDYVTNKGLGNILTPLLGVYDSASLIDFSKLPKRFALKVNYGATMNIICTDKSTLDYTNAIEKLDSWMSSNKKYSFSEEHYNLIHRKIVCEEFIDDGSGHFPTDYKFLCIKGKVVCILVMKERETGKPTHGRYTKDWKALPDYSKGDVMTEEPMPGNLAEMVEIAEKLAMDFPLLRVDLYSNGKNIWFGELTLTPSGCIFHSWSQKAIDELGHIYNSRS